MKDIEARIESYKQKKAQLDDLYDQRLALNTNINKLHSEVAKEESKIDEAIFLSLKAGDILTNGKQEVTITFVNRPRTIYDMKQVRVSPDVVAFGNQKWTDIPYFWISLNSSYLTREGWYIKKIEK